MSNSEIEIFPSPSNRLVFEIDPDCQNCRRGIKKFEKLSERNEEAYGGRLIATRKLVGKVELFPDQNSSGYVTHWHIR